MMKRLHWFSFLTGAGAGTVLIALVLFVRGMMSGTKDVLPVQSSPSGIQFSRQGALSGGMNDPQRLQQMADQFGMTLNALQQELDAGKSIRDIAAEHGAEVPFGRRGGAVASETGGTLPRPDEPAEVGPIADDRHSEENSVAGGTDGDDETTKESSSAFSSQ